VIETWDHLGMRATASHDIVLDDVAIPAEYAWDLRVPGTHPPYGGDPVITGWMNLLVPTVYHGVAIAARDWLLRYLQERVPTSLGAPLATLPRFQHAVGRSRHCSWPATSCCGRTRAGSTPARISRRPPPRRRS
jgi:alkylation response protein AidB-like acyl-CoA dehydrogenase